MAAAVRPRRPLRRGQRLPEGQLVRPGRWRRATGELDDRDDRRLAKGSTYIRT